MVFSPHLCLLHHHRTSCVRDCRLTTQTTTASYSNKAAVLQQESLGTFCRALIDSWEDGVARQQNRGEESYQVSHLGLIVLRKKSTLQTNMVIRGGSCARRLGYLPELSCNHWVACCKGRIESYAELQNIRQGPTHRGADQGHPSRNTLFTQARWPSTPATSSLGT